MLGTQCSQAHPSPRQTRCTAAIALPSRRRNSTLPWKRLPPLPKQPHTADLPAQPAQGTLKQLSGDSPSSFTFPGTLGPSLLSLPWARLQKVFSRLSKAFPINYQLGNPFEGPSRLTWKNNSKAFPMNLESATTYLTSLKLASNCFQLAPLKSWLT